MSRDCFPCIVRARDFYVYDDAGNRYLDLYLGGGRFALGHRLPHRLQMIKSVLARGLFQAYPHKLENRLLKAFQAFFGKAIKVTGFRDRVDCERFLGSYGGVVACWRLGKEDDQGEALFFEPLVPSFLGFVSFVITPAEGAILELVGEPWDIFSVRLIEQSLYALVRDQAIPFKVPHGLSLEKIWRQEGQTLIPTYPASEHTQIWGIFKEKGILLPSLFEEPATLAKGLKKEDYKRLESAIRLSLEKA